MFDFTSIPPEDLRGFVELGKVDDLMNDLLGVFWDLPPEVQYALVKRIRENPLNVDIPLLAEVLGISEGGAARVVKGEGVEVKFPVLEEGGGRVGRVLVVKGTGEMATNLPEKRGELEILGRDFSAFFDCKFTGSSYMLAVAVGLRCDEVPKDLAFTGRVDRGGNVFPTEGERRKEEVCGREGLRLVSFSRLKEPTVDYIRDWITRNTLDVPYYFTTSGGTSASEWRKFLRYVSADPEALELFFGVRKDLLLHVSGRLEGDLWLKVTEDFYRRVSRLQNLERRVHLHIAGRMPASLSFSFGVIFGSQTPFTFYQLQDQEYTPLEVRSVRRLKEVVREPGVVEYEVKGEGEEMVVVLDTAHHTAHRAVEDFMGEGYTYLLITHPRKGNLSPEEMFEVSRETASLLQNLRGRRNFSRYHFFFSCPVAVAFMVGVAFGHYAPADIYNFNSEKGVYERVLRAEDLRRIRESG
jgi:hypothetical protein